MTRILEDVRAICDAQPDLETGGYITSDWRVVEVPNQTAGDPTNNYNGATTEGICCFHSHPAQGRPSEADRDAAARHNQPELVYRFSSGFTLLFPNGEEVDIASDEDLINALGGKVPSSGGALQPSSSSISPASISSEIQSMIAAQSQQNALMLLAKLQKENERLQSEIQVEQSQINLTNQRYQFTERLAQIEAGTQENMLQIAEVTRSEIQIELEQKLKLNQLKYGSLWTLTALQ